ncbi:MAG: type II secretion system F family protein [Actinomycetes bacterium]
MDPTMLIILAVVCMSVAVVVLVMAIRMPAKTEGQRVLSTIAESAGLHEETEHEPGLKERVGDPLLAMILRLGRVLTPTNRLERLEVRLDRAGYPAGWDLNRLLAVKTLCMLVGLAFGFFVATAVNLGFGFFLMIFTGVLGFYAPDYWLTKTAETRTTQMRRALADTVDMLNLTLAAGIGFDSALRLIATNTNGPLSEEFARVVQEIAIGKSRSEALQDLATRTTDEDLSRFCKTCVQAERRGTPFGEILTIQSTELRIKRRQDAEERAQKVPVKILFPMMVFVLPTLMLVVMGPAIAKIMESLGSM